VNLFLPVVQLKARSGYKLPSIPSSGTQDSTTVTTNMSHISESSYLSCQLHEQGEVNGT